MNLMNYGIVTILNLKIPTLFRLGRHRDATATKISNVVLALPGSVAPKSRSRSLDLLRWGLIPSWIAEPKGGRKPINTMEMDLVLVS
jgi:putative SOS response-associated peptidase YedK